MHLNIVAYQRTIYYADSLIHIVNDEEEEKEDVDVDEDEDEDNDNDNDYDDWIK